MLNKEAIKNHLNYLKNNKFSMEFYIALLLYDMSIVESNKVIDKNISWNIQKMFDDMYKKDLRDKIKQNKNLKNKKIEKSVNETKEIDFEVDV